jgi:hypothetical protein
MEDDVLGLPQWCQRAFTDDAAYPAIRHIPLTYAEKESRRADSNRLPLLIASDPSARPSMLTPPIRAS